MISWIYVQDESKLSREVTKQGQPNNRSTKINQTKTHNKETLIHNICICHFVDIVVGAPYEEDLKGAIYVYHGGASQLTLAQRISASQVSSDLHSFGWYISTADDIDKNQYPGINSILNI